MHYKKAAVLGFLPVQRLSLCQNSGRDILFKKFLFHSL